VAVCTGGSGRRFSGNPVLVYRSRRPAQALDPGSRGSALPGVSDARLRALPSRESFACRQRLMFREHGSPVSTNGSVT
jgi:hypothetical protein